MSLQYSIWILSAITCLGFVAASKEQELVKTLLNGYSSQGLDGRPVADPSSPIQVNISFSLIQILEFDQEKQVIYLIGRTALEWVDTDLTWNKTGRIDSIVINPDAVWTPDIILLSLVQPAVLIHQSRLRVSSLGNVTWVQECRYHVNCKTHPAEDSPTCDLRFGSPTFDDTKLQLTSPLNRVDASFYLPNSVWEFHKNKVLRVSRPSPFLSDITYADIKFQFRLRRFPPVNDKDDEEESGAGSLLPSLPAVLVLGLLILHLTSR